MTTPDKEYDDVDGIEIKNPGAFMSAANAVVDLEKINMSIKIIKKQEKQE